MNKIDGTPRRAVPPQPTTPKTSNAAPAATPTPTAKPAVKSLRDEFIAAPSGRGPTATSAQPTATAAQPAAAADTHAAAPAGATTAAATPQDQARQDAGKVSDAYRTGGARAASKQLADLVGAHPGDAAYADALIQASDATLKKIGAELGDRVVKNRDDSDDNPVTRESLENLAKVADAASPAGRDVLAGDIAAGLPNQTDLNQFDDRLSDLAKDGKGLALSSALVKAVAGSKPEAAKELSELSENQVKSAREEYDKAKQAKDDAEGRLARDLAQFGAAMTPREQEAYKAGYREKYKSVYDAEKAAGDKLASTLESNRAGLETLAASGDEGAAKALYEGYKSLANTTNHADDAIRWVSDMSQAPKEQNPLYTAIEKAEGGDLETKLQDDVLANAIPNAQAEILGKDRPGNPEDGAKSALAETEELLKPLKGAKALKDVPKGISDFLDATRTAVQNRNFDAVGQKLLDSWDDKGKFGKALAVAGVAMSAYGAAEAFKDGNYPDAIKKSAAFAQGALELTAGVLHTISSAKGFASDLAGFAARAAPVLGLVVDGIQFAQDTQQVFNDPSNAGHWVEAFGTVVSLAGDVAGIVPVAGTALDVVLGGLGAGIHAIGSFIAGVIDGNREREQLTQEQTELFAKATGLDQGTARELVTAGAKDLERARLLGVTPDQLQELARDPNVNLDSLASAALLKAAVGFGLKGQDVIDLLKAGGNLGPDDQPVYELVTAFGSPETMRGAANHDLSAFRDLVSSLYGHGDAQAKQLLDILQRGDPSKVDFNGWGFYDVLEGDGRQVAA